MSRLIIAAILTLIALVIYARTPARAAMEPDEIMVRLATGLPTRPEVRKYHCIRHKSGRVKCRQAN